MCFNPSLQLDAGGSTVLESRAVRPKQNKARKKWIVVKLQGVDKKLNEVSEWMREKGKSGGEYEQRCCMKFSKC